MNPLDYGLILECAVIAIVAIWIFWSLFGAAITAKFTSAAAVTTAITTAVDVSQQATAYAALTAIRYMPTIEANSQAVAACELLCGVLMTWPKKAST